MLALLFTSIFIHGYIPSEMIDSVLVPIIKNKAGYLADKNNYIAQLVFLLYVPKYWKE